VDCVDDDMEGRAPDERAFAFPGRLALSDEFFGVAVQKLRVPFVSLLQPVRRKREKGDKAKLTALVVRHSKEEVTVLFEVHTDIVGLGEGIEVVFGQSIEPAAMQGF
jgi:hypothetical protein